MELWQIIGIVFLISFACVIILNLIKKNKQNLLKEMYKNGDISEKTYKKYLN